MSSRFQQRYILGSKDIDKHICDHKDCGNDAIYPAPRKQQVPESFAKNLGDGYEIEGQFPAQKYWFCLQHVKEYNQGWDFFLGMSQTEIEDFYDDAATGHRLTRKDIYSHSYEEKLIDKAMDLRNGKEELEPQIPDNELQAMKLLEVSYPITKYSLKKKYRALVKLYHPDKGGKETEEKFKQINEAYNLLRKYIGKPLNVS